MKTLKAILIDVAKQNISEVEVDDDYRAIYPQLTIDVNNPVDNFECVYLDDGQTIYLDGEGLLKNTQHFFEFKGCDHQSYAGNGLILGTNSEGESTSTSLTVEEVKECVTFLTLAQVRAKVAFRRYNGTN